MTTTIEQALKNGDVRTIETDRKTIRKFMDGLPSGEDTDLEAFITNLEEELDEAQGEADEAGKVSYVVLKIEGGSL